MAKKISLFGERRRQTRWSKRALSLLACLTINIIIPISGLQQLARQQHGESGFIHIHAPSGIRTWDLSICLYLNLKHGDVDLSATTAGFPVLHYSQQISFCTLQIFKTTNSDGMHHACIFEIGHCRTKISKQTTC